MQPLAGATQALITRFSDFLISHEKALYFFVFILTLTVRLVFVLQWNGTPYGAMPLLDAKVYYDWAISIADGEIIRGKAFYQSPLYPYFLGLIYALFGKGLVLPGVVNALLEAGTATILCSLSYRLFSPASALFCGLFSAFFRPTIFYTAPLMKEPLGLFLLACYLMLFVRGVSSKSARVMLVCGCVLGLATLVRGNVLFLAPVALAVGFYLHKAAFFTKAAAFILGILICIAPATFHNYVASRDFVLVNYTDGFNLYIGHSPMANGTNSYPPEVSTDPVQEEMNTIWVAQEESKRPLKPSEVSRYWRERALKEITENPWRTIDLTKNKLLAFWNGTEQFDNYDIRFIEKNFGTILSFSLLPYWLLTTLAVFGVGLLWGTRQKPVVMLLLFGGAYMASVLLFYVTDRYRLPVVVFLLPLAGASIPFAYNLLCQKRLKSLLLPVMVSCFVLWLGLRPPSNPVDLEAFDWGTLAMLYSDIEQDEKAIDAFNKAIAISPINAGAASYVRASYAYERMGDDSNAQKVLETALSTFPQNGIVLYNYARFKAARSQLKEALSLFEAASRLSPYYLLNYYALAKGHSVLGNKDLALHYLQKGLSIDPSDKLLNDILREINTTKGSML